MTDSTGASDPPAAERAVSPKNRHDYFRVRWFPLGWAGIALVAQVVFLTVLAPHLPSSFLIWFNADRAGPGDMYYRFDTATFGGVGWVAVAVFAVAGLLCVFIRPDRDWLLFVALGVCTVAPLLIGLLYASVMWQLGRTTPAEEIPGGVGAIVLAVGIAGVFGSLYTLMARRR
jgi:uncharacterized membrane protein